MIKNFFLNVDKLIRRAIRSVYFEPLSSVALSLLYTVFAYRHLQVLQQGFNFSVGIVVFLEGLLVLFFITRHRARARTADTQQLVFALMGTFLPLLLRPVGPAYSPSIGTSLVLLGSLMLVVAYLSLNRSFGLSPSVRVIKTRGLFRFVRHPLYTSYFIIYLGYLLQAGGIANMLIIYVWVYAQIRRAFFEEKILSQVPEYSNYCKQVRWRFIPGIV